MDDDVWAKVNAAIKKGQVFVEPPPPGPSDVHWKGVPIPPAYYDELSGDQMGLSEEYLAQIKANMGKMTIAATNMVEILAGKYLDVTNIPPEVEERMVVAQALHDAMPGLDYVVRCPCLPIGESRLLLKRCPYEASVWDVVIHLNDSHHLAREAIADWVEALPVDLTISTTPQEGTPQ